MTPDVAEAMGLSAAAGALVTDVPEGPAKQAGLLAGDVILTFNGKPVANSRDLTRTVADSPIGEAVPVVVEREGTEMTIDVTLGRRETDEEAATPQAKSDQTPVQPQQAEVMGLSLKALDADIAEELGLPHGTEGLAVIKVDPASEAADKGLDRGDIIVEAGQRPVTSLKDLTDRIDEAKRAVASRSCCWSAAMVTRGSSRCRSNDLTRGLQKGRRGQPCRPFVFSRSLPAIWFGTTSSIPPVLRPSPGLRGFAWWRAGPEV